MWEGFEGTGVVVWQRGAVFMFCSAVGARKAAVRWFSRSADVGGFVVVATRVATNHGVIHQNKVGELQAYITLAYREINRGDS